MILLKRHFPYSLTSSVLLANLCWEFAMSWNKDVTQLESLAAALIVLRQIPMKNLRHGKKRLRSFFFSQQNASKYIFTITFSFNRRLLFTVDASYKKKNGSGGEADE